MMNFASNKIREGYDIVIMGHRHQPVFKEIGKGMYINLGDWMTHFTYAELTNEKIELKRWNDTPLP